MYYYFYDILIETTRHSFLLSKYYHMVLYSITNKPITTADCHHFKKFYQRMVPHSMVDAMIIFRLHDTEELENSDYNFYHHS